MDIVMMAVKLLGGLAMFLYGMEIMGDGLKQGSGTALKNVLGKLTHNIVLGVLTGALVTAIIQSSTATIVLTVGLIGAGILNLRQAVSIVMGANIGTTVTAQIIRLMDIESGSGSILSFFKPDFLAPLALIIGIVLGMICLCIRAFQIKQFGRVVFSLNGQLKFLYTSINNLRAMTTSLTLIVLGGQFEFSAAQGRMREIVVGTLWRIVFAPFIGIGIAVLMSIHTDILKFGINEYPALIAVFGTPAAVSGAIMAGQMGNDEKLATQLIVWTSVGSIATMFLTVCVLMAAGLLAT